MRRAFVAFGLLALVGCGNTSPTPPAAAPAPPSQSAENAPTSLPAGFPQKDLAAQSAECIVYLGLSKQAKATPSGHDAPIMQQAADQWRASLQIDSGLSEAEVQQLIASSVNPLTSTPAAQRDAASAWCVENAAEPDPSKK